MAEQAKVTIEVSFRWWVPLYLHTLAVFCAIFGTDPDTDKVGQTVLRGTVFKVIR